MSSLALRGGAQWTIIVDGKKAGFAVRLLSSTGSFAVMAFFFLGFRTGRK
jgi:hypothetical protein